MKIVVTGAAGFLGSRVAAKLLKEETLLPCHTLILVDVIKPKLEGFEDDSRVKCLAKDITADGVIESLIDAETDVFFHLAAIVSKPAEADFDLGMKVNFDVTRKILEAARRIKPTLKLVFTSSWKVFNGEFPSKIDDMTAVTPDNSYGTAKGMSELLINEYARRGFVDARVIRVPTIVVRPEERSTKSSTFFISGIVRETLNGKEIEVPVSQKTEAWVCSVGAAANNVIYAANLNPVKLGSWRVVTLPGLTLTGAEMVKALRNVAGEKVVSLIKFEEVKIISDLVAKIPVHFDSSRALKLGFEVDKSYEDVIRAYIREDLKNNKFDCL